MKDAFKSLAIGVGLLTFLVWFISPVILQERHVQLSMWMQIASWLPVGAFMAAFFFLMGRIILNTYRYETRAGRDGKE